MTTERKSRQIIVCCDGTSNTLTGGYQDTNVLKIHEHLAMQPVPADVERLLYYDPGVGSLDFVPPTGPLEWLAKTARRASGLASGSGAFENIAEAYAFIMRHWRDEGDRIYLFGFSRGAFTVRAVAGMANLFGVVRPEYEVLVPTLVGMYFSPQGHGGNLVQRIARGTHASIARTTLSTGSPGRSTRDPSAERGRLARQVRDQFAGGTRGDAWVHWIGVWDTVESVGLPGPLSRQNLTPPTFTDKRYRHVRHALSLDEHRWPFLPRLYHEAEDVPAAAAADVTRTLRQRWYPGVHADCGGSYLRRESAISDAALRWMIAEVADDLRVAPMKPGGRAPAAWLHDPLWSNPYWAIGGMTLRPMDTVFGDGSGQTVRFQAKAAVDVPQEDLRSVWQLRRSVPMLLAWTLVAFVSLVASGLCLLEPRSWAFALDLSSGEAAIGSAVQHALVLGALARDSLQAASQFAVQQLFALAGAGVLAAGSRPWDGQVPHAAWAMWWDLVFLAALAYPLGRASTRGFAWLAGRRSPDSTRPAWFLLGFGPMLAVLGDVAEDLLLLAALAMHGMHFDHAALALLWAGGLGSLAKCVGWTASAPLILVGAVTRFASAASWARRLRLTK